MNNRFLLAGIGLSLVLHAVLFGLAFSLEKQDARQRSRKVRLRMVEKAREDRKEKKKEAVEAEKKKALDEEKEEQAKGASKEDIARRQKEAREALDRLKELRERLAEAEKLREKLKPPEPPKPPPETKPPETKPPETKPPETRQAKAEKPPAEKRKKSTRKKRTEKRSEKKAADPQPAGDKPPPPTPELAGARRGAPIDLDYSLSGGTGTGGASGGGVNVNAGDGFDIPEEGYADDPEAATKNAAEAGDGAGDEAAGEEDQEELQEAALPDETGAIDPAAGVGGGEKKARKKDPRARKVKTISKHRVTRDAQFKKKVEVKYPEEVKALEIQGRVYLLVTVDKEGKVADVQLKKGLHPILDKAAIEAAWQLEFEPAMQEGEPVGVKITVPFLFVLE